MNPPEGYEKTRSSQVYKLKRSLYGLKQVGRQWNKEFTAKIKQFSFFQSPYDHCLFVKGFDDSFLALLVYVDDILLTGAQEKLIMQVKKFLQDQFTIKDLGYNFF